MTRSATTRPNDPLFEMLESRLQAGWRRQDAGVVADPPRSRQRLAETEKRLKTGGEGPTQG